MRPIEIWRAPDGQRWHWRCHDCGPLRGGWRKTWSGALRTALTHHQRHGR